MKLIEKLLSATSRVINKSGANGLYVSRKVLNAQEWHDWAKAAGVPNLVPVEEIHVTVIYSTTDAKIPLDCCSFPISTSSDYWMPGAFGFLGKDDEAFCFIFSNWKLSDRNYTYRAAGAVPTWPDYLPHLTLSTDAKGFDLPDSALEDVPQYILLGGEVRADLKQPDPTDADAGLDEEDMDEEDDGVLVVVIELAQKAAGEVLTEAEAGKVALDPAQATILKAMSDGRGVSKAAARHVAKAAWAPDLLKTLMDRTDARGLLTPGQRDETKTKDVTIAVTQISGEVAKNIGAQDGAKGYDEERRWVYGIASVSTVNGELVEDLDGDFITTKCLDDYMAGLVTSRAGGDFEHETDPVNEIVGAMCFSSDLQKSLGIDLGMEFLLTVTHVQNEADWEKVKKGEWMQSIAGVFYYED